MAFMALFGWVFLPIIFLYIVVQIFTAPLLWAMAHPMAVNMAAAGLLAVNLLFLFFLLRGRARRKRNGQPKGLWSLLAVLWELWVVFLWVLYLVIQPLQYIPEDFGQPFDVESVCFDEWELVSLQGIPSGYTRTQEEIDQYAGMRIAYGPDRFTSNGQTYPLDPEAPYDENVIWREEQIVIPGSVISSSFEALGLTDRKLRRAIVNFREEPEERPAGWLFYMLDRDTLLVYYDCMFFQAKRVEAP